MTETTETQKPSFWRHSGWVDPSTLTDKVTLVGCGAVGSRVAIMAAQMGFTEFELWDADLVEPHNLPNQSYLPKHIGMPKVEALAAQLREFNPDIVVTTHNKFFLSSESKDLLAGPLVIATDSMKSRYDLTEAFAYNTKVTAVIEARLGFDYGEIHCINNMDFQEVEYWKSTLKPDDQVPEGPCNLRICPPLIGVVAATMVQYLCVPYAVWRSAGARKPPVEQRYWLQESLIVRDTRIG